MVGTAVGDLAVVATDLAVDVAVAAVVLLGMTSAMPTLTTIAYPATSYRHSGHAGEM